MKLQIIILSFFNLGASAILVILTFVAYQYLFSRSYSSGWDEVGLVILYSILVPLVINVILCVLEAVIFKLKLRILLPTSLGLYIFGLFALGFILYTYLFSFVR